jgi:hypothetical protein
MGWKEEFPLFDGGADCERLIAEGWEDVSWHNDTCPSFERAGIMIWVDYVDRMKRVFPGASSRFGVTVRRPDEVIAECDTLDGALLAVLEEEG